jgi:hypothetical protein
MYETMRRYQQNTPDNMQVNSNNSMTTNMQINSNNVRSTSPLSDVFEDTYLAEYDDKAHFFDSHAWQSIPFNKNAPLPEEVQHLHKRMLMQVLDQLPLIMSDIQRILYVKYRTHYTPDMFCPVVVGGMAYTKYMEYANMKPDSIFFSDDIDIKILIKPTCEDLNHKRTYGQVKECIKLFRYMLTVSLMELVTDILAQDRIAQKYSFKVHYGHAGSYTNLKQLKQDVGKKISPLQLSVISITYGLGESLIRLGCVDMTFYVRENDTYDDQQMMIGYFYSYLRLAHGATGSLIQPRTACDIVPRRDHVTIIATEEYMLLDTIRMLSKAVKFGDVCIQNKDRTPVSDVRKFDKYVGKFLQLSAAFGKLDANRAEEIYYNVFPVVPSTRSMTVRDKFTSLIAHPEISGMYKFYTQFLLEPSAGYMNTGGSPSISRRGNININTNTKNCIVLEPEQLYNDFGIVIQRNNNDPDKNRIISFLPSSGGGKRKPTKPTKTQTQKRFKNKPPIPPRAKIRPPKKPS